MLLNCLIIPWVNMLDQGIVQGEIRHVRYKPRRHQFDYTMYWTLLDLSRLAETFAASPLWSVERWNLISFRRKDYHQHSSTADLRQAICETLLDRTGQAFDGQVYLLTHLRFLGFNFNSVTFYFCVKGDHLAYIIAEITNTPWGEQHQYVLTCNDDSRQDKSASEQGGAEFHRFEFDKQFHISPFMAMTMHYRWGFSVSMDHIRVHMVNTDEDGDKLFDATFTGQRSPLSSRSMWRIPMRRPWQPLKMTLGIYWQSLKLWLKRTPIHDHPDKDIKGEPPRES